MTRKNIYFNENIKERLQSRKLWDGKHIGDFIRNNIDILISQHTKINTTPDRYGLTDFHWNWIFSNYPELRPKPDHKLRTINKWRLEGIQGEGNAEVVLRLDDYEDRIIAYTQRKFNIEGAEIDLREIYFEQNI